jgi:hypothetical protein
LLPRTKWRASNSSKEKGRSNRTNHGILIVIVLTTIRIGDVLGAEMAPYRSADGKPTKLVDSIFSTIPGSPAYVGKASYHKVNLPEFNFTWEYNGRNAIQGEFRFEA